MSVQVVNIELLGTTFAVQTDESVEYIEKLVAQLRNRLETLRASTRVQDPVKLSILASVTILDELERVKEGFGPQAGQTPPMRAGQPAEDGSSELPVGPEGSDEIERVAARLIAVLDRSLDPDRQ